jgi:hypothetical protein
LEKSQRTFTLQRLRSNIGHKLQTNQYAYQKSVSTTDALLHATHDWCESLDSRHISHITAAFIDMSKAFDRMDPKLLIKKLQALDTNPGLIHLIVNFLSDHRSCVKFQQEQSTYSTITMGAPQGTKLGPWLWLVYIDDLRVSSDQCKLVKYADDLTLYSCLKKKDQSNIVCLQDELNHITDWATENNMLVNASKTKILHLTLSEPKYNPQFYMDGHLLASSTTAKLLGVTIDSRLTFSHHIDNMCNSLASRLYAMRELKRLGLNSSGLLLYYTANIRSLLTYACPVWGTIISDHHQQRITQIERRALKIVNPDISYNEAIGNHNLQPVVSFIDDITRRLMSKIDNNPGHPLRELITYKTGRRTRVSLSTNMPVCRTAKLMRSFFYKYGKFYRVLF